MNLPILNALGDNGTMPGNAKRSHMIIVESNECWWNNKELINHLTIVIHTLSAFIVEGGELEYGEIRGRFEEQWMGPSRPVA